MKNSNVTLIKDIPAFLFMLMLWRVLPAKILAIVLGDKGESLGMGGVVVICIVGYVAYVWLYLQGRLLRTKAYIIPIIGVAVLAISVIIHLNDYNTLYLNYYLRYVLVPALCLISVKNFEYLLELYGRFALVTFFVLGWQPITASNVFANYMDYGFTVALPCSIGLYILAKLRKNIVYKVLAVIAIGFAIAFANRSTWLCILIFIILFNLIIEKAAIKKIGFLILLFIIALLVAYNFEKILDWLISLNNMFNYNSHSLMKFQQLLSGTTLDVFTSGRDTLSKIAREEIMKWFPFGAGVGYFESKTGMYSHNIFYDFLLDWGAIGGIVFLIVIIYIFKSLIKENNSVLKVVKLLLLCLWFPKLFFSGTFTYELAFWGSIVISIKNPLIKPFRYKLCINNERGGKK